MDRIVASNIFFGWIIFVAIYGFYLAYIRDNKRTNGLPKRVMVAGFLYAPKFWTVWVTVILLIMFIFIEI